MDNKIKQQKRRKIRVRSKIFGTGDRPRLSVHRSNRYINAQIIDDTKQKTLLGLSEKSLSLGSALSPIERAQAVGEELAKRAKSRKIDRVVFDRGAYCFHGRVKALAEGARKGGLEF
jgi:large subunit ribosomal protein L18